MNELYPDDHNFQHGESVEIAEKLKRYIANFEKLYQCVNKEKVKRIIDLA